MANPRDDDGSVHLARGGEFYLNERTGRTHVRLPAGGSGGGVTSYADVPATEEQHVAYLKELAEQKRAEAENLQQQHEDAHTELQKKQEEGAEGEADINNPITAESYGRPPQHVDPGNKKGPHNPADERDFIDSQPHTEAPVQPDPNEPAPVKEPAAVI